MMDDGCWVFFNLNKFTDLFGDFEKKNGYCLQPRLNGLSELFFANHPAFFYITFSIAKKARSESGTGFVRSDNLVAPKKKSRKQVPG